MFGPIDERTLTARQPHAARWEDPEGRREYRREGANSDERVDVARHFHPNPLESPQQFGQGLYD